MNLREALEELGPERVKRGMRAFESEQDSYRWNSCFIARSFGEKEELSNEWRRRVQLANGNKVPLQTWPEFAGTSELGLNLIISCFDRCRIDLYEACIQFLAETGSALEPSPVQTSVLTSAG